MVEINEVAKALNAFQAEVVSVGKEKDNLFFKSKYAPLDTIMKAAQPVLTKHGLAVSQLVDNLDGQTALTTLLMHTSGQSIKSTMPLVLPKNDPQGQGSAITYARRYSYAAALGIVIDEDDDGNKASTPPKTYKKSGSKPKATDKQKALIAKKLSEQGIAVEDMAGWLTENYGISGELNIEDAKMVIDDLLSE